MKDVDFPHSNLLNLQKITKPPDPKRKSVPVTKKEASHSFSTFEIEKSFVPPPKSIINEALRPEIDNLKQFLRRKRENEKRLKEMLAEGLISREELNSEPKEKVKQEEVKEKVKIDESGQARDESDNLLYVKNRTTELLINQKKEQDAQLKALKGKQKVKHTIKISRNLLDRNLFVSTSKKRLRRSLLGLQFLEQGSYQAVDTKTETKKKIENLADVFEEEEVRVIKRRNKVSLQSTREAFPIEWWDAQLLKVTSYAELKEQMSNGKSVLDFIDLNSISDLVQYQRVGAED